MHRVVDDRDAVVEAPAREGDILFWPPWALHTFNALDHGFALFSAMGTYLSPETEHFIAEPPAGMLDLDTLPRVAYSELA